MGDPFPPANSIRIWALPQDAPNSAAGQIIDEDDTTITGIAATCRSCIRGSISIKNNVPRVVLLANLIHEIGHAHGLSHSKTGTMAPKVVLPDNINEFGISQNGIDASTYIQEVSEELNYSMSSDCITSTIDIANESEIDVIIEKNHLSIDNTSNNMRSFHIVNSNGQYIFSQDVNTHSSVIRKDLSQYPSGIYFLSLHKKNGNIESLKMFISNE